MKRDRIRRLEAIAYMVVGVHPPAVVGQRQPQKHECFCRLFCRLTVNCDCFALGSACLTFIRVCTKRRSCPTIAGKSWRPMAPITLRSSSRHGRSFSPPAFLRWVSFAVFLNPSFFTRIFYHLRAYLVLSSSGKAYRLPHVLFIVIHPSR
jgi:hypothetical protein